MTTLNPVGMDPSGVITISTCLIVIPFNNGGNYWPDILSGDAGVYNKQTYEKKTFGILERNGSKTIQ